MSKQFESNSMKLEIWSDVMCPFCYIGKRRLEEALAIFANAEDIQVSWKSFQLDQTLKTDTSISVQQSLSNSKGWNLAYAHQVTEQVTAMAAQAGLQFDFEKAVVANSFNAHRLIQLAKQHGLDTAAEEALFAAYFTLGQNVDATATLIEIGSQIGLDTDAVANMLNTDALSDSVHADIYEAEQLQIKGVPFFVLNEKYAISGAQPAEVFLQALNTAYQELGQEQATSPAADGAVCDTDGNCN